MSGFGWVLVIVLGLLGASAVTGLALELALRSRAAQVVLVWTGAGLVVLSAVAFGLVWGLFPNG